MLLALDNNVQFAGQADKFAGSRVRHDGDREARLASVHDAGVLQREAALLAVK